MAAGDGKAGADVAASSDIVLAVRAIYRAVTSALSRASATASITAVTLRAASTGNGQSVTAARLVRRCVTSVVLYTNVGALCDKLQQGDGYNQLAMSKTLDTVDGRIFSVLSLKQF